MHVLSKEGTADSSAVTWEYPMSPDLQIFPREAKSLGVVEILPPIKIVLYMLAIIAVNKKQKEKKKLWAGKQPEWNSRQYPHEVNKQDKKSSAFPLR